MLKKSVFILMFLALSNYGPMKVAMADNVTEIGWDNLIPESWLPDPKTIELYNAGKLKDDDPSIIALKEKIKKLREQSPVNDKLDGKKIKIPGYVVPLEMDEMIVREFLLVPYHGACVHVPPPPANQTIYVKASKNSARTLRFFDTVWVTGTIKVIKTTTDVAESGFTIHASNIELYE